MTDCDVSPLPTAALNCYHRDSQPAKEPASEGDNTPHHIQHSPQTTRQQACVQPTMDGYIPKSGKFGKVKPKRYHGYNALLFVLGTLFPPLAVAARFGIGKDFWLNLLLTLCGYFPGHFHNFYIQNIRNNKNNARTPKWAARYGLVDTTVIERKKKRSEWAKRYNERNPQSALDAQEYEEGQRPDRVQSHRDGDDDSAPRDQTLWTEADEQYYRNSRNSTGPYGDSSTSLPSTNSGGGGGRWTYPANFDDAVVEGSSRRKKKSSSSKKDRWTRTEEAYAANDEPRRKKKKKKSRSVDRGLDGAAAYDDMPQGQYYQAGEELDAGYDRPSGGAGGWDGGARPEEHQQPNGGQDVFDHQF